MTRRAPAFAATTFLLLWLSASLAGAQSETLGSWSPSQTLLPFDPRHAHLLPTGKVMLWTHTNHVLWTPETGAVAAAPYPGYNAFCSGHTALGNGLLFTVGGRHLADGVGEPFASAYDPVTNTWTSAPNMNAGRWYPSAITLANGDALALSGAIDNTVGANTLPQVFQVSSQTWRDLTNAQLSLDLYPRVHLAPNGMVVNVGPSAVTRYLDTSGAGAWTVVGNRNGGYRDYASSVMYDDGKILFVGGGDPPTNAAEVIDLNAASPAWRSVAPMTYARRHLNITLLPDGRVLVTGGTSGAGFNNRNTPVYPAEIWDPATETWATVASSIGVPRIYHSVAVLLPDGRVLAAGGDDQTQVETYSPDYLFKGARPTITSAPASVGYGQTFFVETPDAALISQVTWIRLSSVTHATNMNQRINRLSSTPTAGGLNVVAPSSGNLAPPGDYMLFVLNNAGVPSVAKIVRLAALPDNPVPVGTGLSPSVASVGGAAFTLTVSGSNFVQDSKVRWKGVDRPTTYVNATRLTAAIAAEDIAAVGQAAVTVFNPAPGGGTSSALTFTIADPNPVPTASDLSPSSAAAGDPAFTLTVNGSNFIQSSKVRWKGVDRPTTYVSPTRLTAAISMADIATAGTAAVTVFNPAPDGGTSSALTFTIADPNPVPTATDLSPSSAGAGGAAFTLTVNGSNFIQSSKVRWKGVDRPTTYVSPTRLTAAISMADIATAGTAAVTVFNPAPDGGTSNELTFTIAQPNPVPTASSLSPSSTAPGGGNFTLTVNGSNFIPTSVVRWKGVDKTTSYVNANQVTATILAADIAAAGSAAVTVFNQTPGGGTSNALTFSVAVVPTLRVSATSVAPGTAVTVTLEGGLGGARDWLGLAAVGSANTSYVTWTYVGTGVTTRTWTVTVAAGTWEFRLFQNDGYTRLATSPTITAMGNPTPTASSLSPASAAPGGGNFTLTVTGSNFIPTSVVRWKGVDRTTSFVSATQVRATILAADIAAAGPAAVTVFNPTPGGGTSNALTFSVASGPTLKVSATSVAPGTAVTVTVEGGLGGSTDWLALAAVGSANSSYVAWTYVGAGVTTRTWSATVGAGTWEFRLFQNNGFTRLATSPTITAMGNPVPAASTLSPTSAVPGGGTFTLTVNGSNLIPTSVVRWKGVDKATGYVNATQVTATIPAADIAAAGTAAVTVFNPTPGGGTSNALTFTVATVPTLRVNATRVTPGTAVTVTLEGGLGGARDWLGLAAVGSANTSYVAWTYVGSGVTTRTWTVTLAAGTWEFRLFQNDGYTRLATSPTVTAAP